MVFLGILLAAAAVATAVAVVTENSASASVNLLGHHVPGVSTQAHIFILGVIVSLIFVVGLTIASLALGRSVRVHRELRELRVEHRESLSSLEMEKRQLERELARARGGTPPSRPGPVRGQLPQGLPTADRTGEGLPTAGRRATDGTAPTQPTAFRPDSPFFQQR